MGIEKIKSIKDVTPNGRGSDLLKVYDLQVSGNSTFVLGGIIVHNSDVEYGHEARPIKGTQRVYVKTYVKKNGTVVQGHWVEYKGKKIIGFRPKFSKFERGEKIYRIISEEPKQEGQKFLTRAVEDKIQELPVDIEFYTRQLSNKHIK